MLTQNIATDLLVELAPEEQQLLSGGCQQSLPCCKPKKQKCGCGEEYSKSDQFPPSDKYETYPNNGDS
ncbi:MAG: hypothetical protein HCA25_14420 [Dolichospermum sp. DET50]|nr:hypothetical protein [Dolichospermum sp. DET66]MBS3033433.1 hypothetical protein [Dolichospermum sp. DET67]MBS3038637.1 hypothetical protein [Dolichospermum sp. DET50]QSX65919.1 MAG: hypothetical protein EZY12_13670 [Dolichospermum sp. DET69]